MANMVRGVEAVGLGHSFREQLTRVSASGCFVFLRDSDKTVTRYLILITWVDCGAWDQAATKANLKSATIYLFNSARLGQSGAKSWD